MTPYPYLAVHVASSLSYDQDEADDHSDNFSLRGEMLSAGSPEELWDLFSGLARQGARISYLDFHCHGYPGTLSLGKAPLNYSSLRLFRRNGFDGLFRSNATISFMSCDIAAVKSDQDDSGQDGGDEDGELFLSEIARIFLGRNGRTAEGWNMEMHYKPSTIWRGPIFKSAGTKVIAEIAPGASRAVLKGQCRLDEKRIKLEVAVLRSSIVAVLGLLQGQSLGRSYREDTLPGPATKMLADAFRRIETAKVNKDKAAYTKCIALLDGVVADLRGLSSEYYFHLHKACVTIDLVADTLVRLGVPLGKVVPHLLTLLQAVPVL